MQMSEDTAEGQYLIQAYEPGTITINAQPYQRSLIISHNILITDWQPQSLEALNHEDMIAILALKPTVLLLGTGVNFKMPKPAQLAPLYQAGLGVESMDTGAACRTFMALLAEGRQVVAALLIK